MIPAPLLAVLRERHAEKGRRYHSWAHVEALQRHFLSFAEAWHRPRPVWWAIAFHDAVYKAREGGNEEASAALLRREASPFLSDADLALAAWMIEATASHRVPDLPHAGDRADCALFLDLDLSVLGAPADSYHAYSAAIRAEYHFVPDQAYRAGRAALLRGFLERPRLYFTDAAAIRWESGARANLAREIGQLEND